MPTTRKSAPAARPVQKPLFSELLQVQFHLVARLSERQAEKENQETFGLRLSEARIIGLIGAYGALPIRFLTSHAHFEKGHASRMVSALVRKGLVRNKLRPEDQRANILRLTPKGENIHAKFLAFATMCNKRWLDVLPNDQHEALSQALATLLKLLTGTDLEAFGKIWRSGAAVRSSPARRTAKAR